MSHKKNVNLIIFADDDSDDQLLMKEAFEENNLPCQLDFVENGHKLIEYLKKNEENPSLILLDINMPGKDGREILSELKLSLEWRHIPIIMFSTSKSPEDVRKCYELGANSYIVKPSSFEGLLKVTNIISKYWIDTVALHSTQNKY